MRIVVDMQGAQTESRLRGIGRYSLSLVKAMVQNRQHHEILLSLNALFPESINAIRDEFDGLLPQENIRVWCGVGPTREVDPFNAKARRISENLREVALCCMQPDVILITSLFEGWVDDAATSVGKFDKYTPIAAVLYDLIPLISPDKDFRSNPALVAYYHEKIESLKKCQSLLAISESARQEVISVLKFPSDTVTNISSACDPCFQPMQLTETQRKAFLQKFGIDKNFVMYAGGADENKNLHRLIEAFASLPANIRRANQLLMVGNMPFAWVEKYRATAKIHGLADHEIIFTGYVADQELISLYSACNLFVFPSIHEGFGLPPLEAMSCGAPVIASNATSLPEVVGNEHALFDPLSALAIRGKMLEVLSNDYFRSELIEYGKQRAQLFSWDACAKKALSALERIAQPSRITLSEDSVKETDTSIFKSRHLKIIVSKLDHMGDLILAIPALRRLKFQYPQAKIDAIIGSWNLALAQSLDLFNQIHVIDFFSKKSSEAAKITQALNELIKQLQHYDIAIDLRRQADTRFLLTQLPATLRVGYSTGDKSVDAQLNICLPSVADVPFERTYLNNKSIALQMLSLIDALPVNLDSFIEPKFTSPQGISGIRRVAIFPKAGNEVKEWGDNNYQSLIQLLADDPSIAEISVFLGSESETHIYENLLQSKLTLYSSLPFPELKERLAENSVCVANNSFGAHFAAWLGVRVVAIYGGHETVEEWGPVFGDCRVIHFPTHCSPCHIPSKAHCPNDFVCLNKISPARVYQSVRDALDGVRRIYCSEIKDKLISVLAPDVIDATKNELTAISLAIDRNIPIQRTKRLFVDISELVQRDARTGIQRVVRNVLKEWLTNPPQHYRIEPVYATVTEPYRFARRFTSQFMLRTTDEQTDEFIDFAAGDVFFVLDLQPQIQVAHAHFFRYLRQHGIAVKFLVHDLLPVLRPEYFPSGAKKNFIKWLRVVAENDGAVCVSRTVAAELSNWILSEPLNKPRGFKITSNYNGADVSGVTTPDKLPPHSLALLQSLKQSTSFLMVGTLEPRKGHAQTLDAFEILWQAGADVKLIVVGKPGWMVETLIDRLNAHPELRNRLYWLDGISDEYLEKIYAASAGLIAASYGEGFGLPLIEAAQHKLPIIARDIPVFREVAGEHVYYFKAEQPADLAHAIKSWLELYKTGLHPKSDNMPWLTWKESATQLIQQII